MLLKAFVIAVSVSLVVSSALPENLATKKEKKTMTKRQVPFLPDGTFMDYAAYDYYDWVCTNGVCQVCDVLTGACCNPRTQVNCFLPDSCANNPCLSGGTCIPTVTVGGNPDFTCVCLRGLTGKYCQLIDEFTPPFVVPMPVPLPGGAVPAPGVPADAPAAPAYGQQGAAPAYGQQGAAPYGGQQAAPVQGAGAPGFGGPGAAGLPAVPGGAFGGMGGLGAMGGAFGGMGAMGGGLGAMGGGLGAMGGGLGAMGGGLGAMGGGLGAMGGMGARGGMGAMGGMGGMGGMAGLGSSMGKRK